MTIVQRVLDDVQAHARDEAPRECCGLLVGTGDRISDSVRALNLEEGTTRFRIDPRDHIRAIREARAHALDVIGFYHSHPRSRAYPSPTDMAEAGYAGAAHLIVGVSDDGTREARLFVIEGEQVQEIEFSVAGPTTND